MTEPNRRTLVPPPLPADFAAAHSDLAKLIEELARHRADRGQIRQQRMTLENSLPVARQKDLALETEAFRAGKPEPGTPNEAGLYQEIGPLEHREELVRNAIAATERDLVALHAAHSADWLVEALQRANRAREAAGLALVALREAFGDVSSADALAAWCAGGKHLPLGVPVHGSRLRSSIEPIAEALERVGRVLAVVEPKADEPEAEAEAVA